MKVQLLNSMRNCSFTAFQLRYAFWIQDYYSTQFIISISRVVPYSNSYSDLQDWKDAVIRCRGLTCPEELHKHPKLELLAVAIRIRPPEDSVPVYDFGKELNTPSWVTSISVRSKIAAKPIRLHRR